MARKTSAASQRCHECLSVEEKTSSNTSCFSSVTGEEKEAEVGGDVSMEERQPSAAARARQTRTLKPFGVSKLEKVLQRFQSESFPFLFFSFFCSCHRGTFCCSLWTSTLID